MNGGAYGEELAARHLETELGWQIVERNWRRTSCEVDIIAFEKLRRFPKVVRAHLVEVKYREGTSQGHPLEMINASKLGHLRIAAQLWQQETGFEGEISIDAVGVQGSIDSPDIDVRQNIQILG